MRKVVISPSIALLSTFLFGCSPSTHDFLKSVETKAYDQAASSVSKYCENTSSYIVDREGVEMAREIRQRGSSGPEGPLVEVQGLDNKTAYGPGPVVFIYCEGETVPNEAWNELIK